MNGNVSIYREFSWVLGELWPIYLLSLDLGCEALIVYRQLDKDIAARMPKEETSNNRISISQKGICVMTNSKK